MEHITPHIILSDRISELEVLHPITLHFIKNESSKFLTLPYGESNELGKQEYFTNESGPVNNNYNMIFNSADYFMKANFNATTFDEKIKVIDDRLTLENHKETIGFMISRLISSVQLISESEMEKIVTLYIKFYSTYNNEILTYSEVFDLVKKKYHL